MKTICHSRLYLICGQRNMKTRSMFHLPVFLSNNVLNCNFFTGILKALKIWLQLKSIKIIIYILVRDTVVVVICGRFQCYSKFFKFSFEKVNQFWIICTSNECHRIINEKKNWLHKNLTHWKNDSWQLFIWLFFSFHSNKSLSK